MPTGCPLAVSIRPSAGPFVVGDVLTCTSDSAVSTYSFTDSAGTVTDGNTVALSEAGSFSFICTATVDIPTPCRATAIVSGHAISKKLISVMYY